MTTVMAAAREGDRHTHNARTRDQDSGALLSIAAGALVSMVGAGGVTVSLVGAGAASGGGGSITTRDIVAHGTSGKVSKGSPRTFVGQGKLPVAQAAGEPADCHHHRDKPLRTGSATVFAEGLRLARQADETACGAVLCDGEPTVLVGGAPEDSAPPNPMAPASAGPALASLAVSAALAVRTAVTNLAQHWAETLVGEAHEVVGEVEVEAGAAVQSVEAGARVAASELGAASDLGAWIG